MLSLPLCRREGVLCAQVEHRAGEKWQSTARSGPGPVLGVSGSGAAWSPRVVRREPFLHFIRNSFPVLSETQSKKTGVATFDHNQLLSGVSVCCMYVLLRN